MQFSYNWLSEYVATDSPQQAAEALTSAGLNVDLIEEHTTDTGDRDSLLEIEVTTNRPDAMNHFGLAREISVVLGRELRWPDAGAAAAAELEPSIARVVVEDPDLCPRFTARVIEGVTIGPSPQWLVDRLAGVGVRSINNVVDVTNYLLWEWGQPQHAYDLDTLAERTIVVRRSRAGETVKTLDGEVRELEDGMCVITDPSSIIGVGGVMGGLDTEVTEKTTRILLEAAWFDPDSVRLTSRRLGLHTDASHRFERGADYDLAMRANDRACKLIVEVAGGEVLEGAIDVCSPHLLPSSEAIQVDPAAISRFAGAEIDPAAAQRWLEGLGFSVEAAVADQWQVVAPTWRALDVELRADVYEEVIRIFGYDNVPTELPAMRGADAPESTEQRRRRLVREHMVACGFAEAIDWAFHAPERDQKFPLLATGGQADGGPVTLQNPLSELYSVMRRSLLPGLVESALFNQRRGAEAVRLFEIGHVFGDQEVEALAMIGGGNLVAPWQGRRGYSLFDLKGCLESLAKVVRFEFEVFPAELPGLVSGTAAELLASGLKVGHFGQIEDQDASYPLYCLEVVTSCLGDDEVFTGHSREVEAPSRFPGITSDLTLTHSLDTSWSVIDAAIVELREDGMVPSLQDFEMIDRYQGKGVPEGAVNTTITFRYGSNERSLTQDEVNEQHRALSGALTARLWGQA